MNSSDKLSQWIVIMCLLFSGSALIGTIIVMLHLMGYKNFF
ncbi:hypothetical protein [Turicibacter sanguinis]|nr:hypothetical protein [Turicibacter sanguinis]MDB8574031.1 hypothetical protein [Turicibacter sanguinis]MDB8576782.1 hypothetical protein [Turicibacter sanguinis]MDB8582812.1 hypothetical protein [Turicibacter sanguinis]MDB8587244.1 hypothetical protein [Turicibacter sanguinis]MDB8596578.1 hypothetical protein [Turicibacter sanguinis]